MLQLHEFQYFIYILYISATFLFLPAVFKDTNTPSPFVELFVNDDGCAAKNALPDHIYMDCMGFGMGCSCLQVYNLIDCSSHVSCCGRVIWLAALWFDWPGGYLFYCASHVLGHIPSMWHWRGTTLVRPTCSCVPNDGMSAHTHTHTHTETHTHTVACVSCHHL